MQTLAQLSVVFVSVLSLSFAAGCGYTHTASAHDVACRYSKSGCGAQPNAPAQTTTTAAAAPAPTTTTFLPPSQPVTPTSQPAPFASTPMAPPPSTVALGSGTAAAESAPAEEPAPPPKPARPTSSKKARRAPTR